MPNYQLIRADYLRQRKDFDDKVIIHYRDVDTNTKHFKIVEDPTIKFYINKPEHLADTQVSSIELDKVDEIELLNRKLLFGIANELDAMNGNDEKSKFVSECFRSGKAYTAKRVHLDANVHGSDVEITDHYIDRFIEEVGESDRKKLHKGYFDIEVDIIDHDGFPEPEEAPCPVNIITYFDAEEFKFYTSILIQDDNDSMIQFMESQEEEAKQEIIDMFISDLHVRIPKLMKKNKKEEIQAEIDRLTEKYRQIQFEVKYFREEIDVISYFYDTVNRINPDTCGAWNLGFDALTNMKRCEILGYDHKEIMTPKEIPYKYVEYYADTRTQLMADKGDWHTTGSGINWMDQMIQYASLRKSTVKESYALDAIAASEVYARKIQFEGKETIKNIPWINFKKFFIYNVTDVFLLHLIEEKTNDLDTLYSLSIMTRTRISKAMKKTVCLRNLAAKFYRDKGYAISNNHNATYGGEREESEKIRGAYVSDPTMNKPTGIRIGGKKSKFMHSSVIDMDLSSLYPSIILAFNIDSATQICKLLFFDETTGEELQDKYIDSLVSRDWINIGVKWFNLPTAEDLINELSKLGEEVGS